MKRLLHTPLALLVWRIALLYAALMLCRAAFWVYNAALLGPPEWSELGQLVAGSLKFDTASAGSLTPFKVTVTGRYGIFSGRNLIIIHRQTSRTSRLADCKTGFRQYLVYSFLPNLRIYHP